MKTRHLLFCLLLFLNIPSVLPQHRIFTRKDVTHGLSDNQVQHILQLHDGRMAITTKGNINIYDGNSFRYIHYDENCEYELEDYEGAYHVYEDSSSRLWVKDYRRLRCFDLRHTRYISNIDSLFRTFHAKESVKDLFVDSNGEVWLVTRRHIRNEKGDVCIEKQTDSGILQDVDISADGIVLFYSNGEAWHHSFRKGRPSHSISAYDKNKAGLTAATSLVVKAEDGSFYQLRCGKESALLKYSDCLSECTELLRTDYVLHTLAVSPDQSIYITSPEGIWHISPSGDKKELIDSLSAEQHTRISAKRLNTIFFDSQGGTWLGTYNSGLLYSHPDRFRFFSVRSSASQEMDRLGLPTKKEVHLHAKYGREHYTDVLRDRRGWIWAGTVDGLLLFRNDKEAPQKFYAEDGLSNNYVHSIAEDYHGNLWIGTSAGITKVNIRGNSKAAVMFEQFGHNDGCLNGEYSDGKALMLPDSTMFMAGTEGWTTWHPDSVNATSSYFKPQLVGISVNGRTLKVGENLMPEAENFMRHFDFDTDENSIVFDISPLNYSQPSHTIFAYKLSDGNEASWHIIRYNDHHTIQLLPGGILRLPFLYLHPGNYELQVKAAMSTDISTAPALRLTFTIRTPWWQTKWAYILYAATGICLLLSGFFIYNRITRIRLRRKYKEELLLLRIKGLIEQCNEYEQRINDRHSEKNQAETSDQEPETLLMSTPEYEFVDKAISLVKQNLDTPGYGVEQLSRDLCMERTGLYKKMTQLLDQSPSVFIRSIRIQRAAELLRSGTMSVADVAAQSGFSSSSYMSKCFIGEFGCTPSEYIARFSK